MIFYGNVGVPDSICNRLVYFFRYMV